MWYVCLHGKQVPLAKGKRSKREAEDAFHRLMAAAETTANANTAPADDGRGVVVAGLLDQFLDWVQQNLDCYEWHRRIIQEFANACGHLTVGELKPIHVTNWLATKKTWGPTTRNRVIGEVKQVFNWSVDHDRCALANRNRGRSGIHQEPHRTTIESQAMSR